jgi:hypothetical protein
MTDSKQAKAVVKTCGAVPQRGNMLGVDSGYLGRTSMARSSGEPPNMAVGRCRGEQSVG